MKSSMRVYSTPHYTPQMPKQRNAVALDIRAKYANNVCPICWMPLCLGNGDMAFRWRAVQMAFKGKPAFSIRNPYPGHGEVGRPIKAFGICPFTASTMPNYEQCHYVHFSMFGEHSDLRNLWYGCEFGGCDLKNNDNEPQKMDSFFARVREDKSLFAAVARERSFLTYIDRVSNDPNSNWNVITLLAVKMFRFFPGCVDCNSHMTISKPVKTLFDQLFPVGETYISREDPAEEEEIEETMMETAEKRKPRGKKKTKNFNTEEMMHYLMLSGMVQNHDMVNKYTFNIREQNRKNTWTLKYIMMWCALQIVLCQWNMHKTGKTIRHHRFYIDYGIMDFYMSLWFYALHCLNYAPNDDSLDLKLVKTEDSDRQTFEDWLKSDKDTLAENIRQFTRSTHPLEFEEFHYYYASVMPFFIRKYINPTYKFSNLSEMVFSLRHGGESAKSGLNLGDLNKPALLVMAVKQNLSVIYKAMFLAWDTFLSHLSDMIHRDMPDGAEPMGGVAEPVRDAEEGELTPQNIKAFMRKFFTKPSQIIAKRQIVQRLPLEIQSFNDHLSSFWYWFHFKHITMAQIWRLCKEYCTQSLKSGTSDKADSTTCVVLWHSWYRQFDIRVKALGAGRPSVLRGLMELRAKMIAEKMNVGRL